MDLTEFKSGIGHKRNRIVLKNLSKSQKDLLMSGGVIASGIGIGTGFFSLYSMSEPDVIPGEKPEFVSSGNSVEKTNDESPENHSEEMSFYTNRPVSNMNQDDVSFNEAFKVAREEVGPGGWFMWKDKVFNTYYKEEWEKLSPDDKIDYTASFKIEENDFGDSRDDIHDLSSTVIHVEDEIPENELHHTREEPQESQIFNEVVSENIDALLIDQSVNAESIQIKLDEAPIEFEFKEDAFILEIPAGSNENIESMVFDATENNLFLNDREEVSGSISPIEIKNLSNKYEASDDIGLAQHWKSIVEEYPWGESIIKTDHTDVESGSVGNSESGSESVLENGIINKSDEILEYPWGETVAKDGNVSFAHDIQVIDDPEQFTVELIDINNPIEEYPWGEKLNHIEESNASQIDDLYNSNHLTIHNNLHLDDDTDIDINE